METELIKNPIEAQAVANEIVGILKEERINQLTNVFWEAMQAILKNSVKIYLQKYEDDKKYRIKKIYELEIEGKPMPYLTQLKGFCVCHDEDDFTVLDECHYIGSDKYAALKMWKFMTAGKKNLRIICQKANTKMAEFYKKIGFKIIGESDLDFTFTRVK